MYVFVKLKLFLGDACKQEREVSLCTELKNAVARLLALCPFLYTLFAFQRLCVGTCISRASMWHICSYTCIERRVYRNEEIFDSCFSMHRARCASVSIYMLSLNR